MNPHLGRESLLSVLAAAMLCSALAAATPTVPLTPSQRREAANAIARFRKATDDAARSAAADTLLELGPAGAAGLLAAVDQNLAPLRRRYRADLLAATRRLLRDRLKDQNSQELEDLQNQVRALSQNGLPSKDDIVTKGDPALAKLERLLIVKPDEVLQANPALRNQRQRLLDLGRYRTRAVEYLIQHAPEAAAALPDRRPFEETLRDHEDVTSLLAIAPGDSERRILIENADTAATLPAEEARGIRRLNQIRILLGMRPLRIDTALCDAARDHSKDMVTKKFFSHTSPVEGKTTPGDRAKRFGTTAHAENIASGATTGPGAIKQWWYSPGHHVNMLGNHSRIGLGRYGRTWTMMLG